MSEVGWPLGTTRKQRKRIERGRSIARRRGMVVWIDPYIEKATDRSDLAVALALYG